MKLSRLGRSSLVYAQAFGWAVFPLTPRDKLPLIPRDQGGRGFLDATTDPDQIADWWSRRPDANIGIATGGASGFCAADIDPRNLGDGNWENLIDEHGQIPDTVQALTGGGGTHILFACNLPCTKLAPGVDWKGDGGYICAPPSIHPSGRQYCWEASSRPDELTIAPAPQWIIDLVASPHKGKAYIHSNAVDPNAFALGAAFSAAGMLGEQIRPGTFAVLCPNREHHSAGKDYDTSTVIFAPRPGQVRGIFHCSHEHCRSFK
jgi:hypothetical protein